MAGTAFAGTGVATDPPDIRLLPGTPLNDAFDLGDYVIGGMGSVDIPGSADIGITIEEYAVGDMTVSNVIKVSSFLVQNGPTLAGGDNPFVNVLRPGVAVSSAKALVGAPADGGGPITPGGVTPGGVTAPVWYITFATVASSYDEGLRVRNTSLIAESDGPMLQAGGLKAQINEAGVYTLEADATFSGPVIVSFVSQAGANLDGTSLLATKEIASGGSKTSADAQMVTYPVVNVGSGEVTVSVDATPSGAGVAVALAALDSPGGTTGFADLSYVQLVVGGKVTLKVTYAAPSGYITPLVMASGGSATFDNLQVYAAPAIVDLAYGANELDLYKMGTTTVVDGNLNSATLADLSPNAPNAAQAKGTVSLSDDNNFGASGQSAALGEPGEADNVTLICRPLPGPLTARIWAKGGPHIDFVMTGLKGGALAMSTGRQADVDFAGWTQVSISGVDNGADVVWITAQGVGGSDGGLKVDDMKALQVIDLDEYFDADLFAL
jgi:hypothetical protein